MESSSVSLRKNSSSDDGNDAAKNIRRRLNDTEDSEALSTGTFTTVNVEHVSPSYSTYFHPEKNETNWRYPIEVFTSQKQGSSLDSKKMSREVRKFYKNQDKLISFFEDIHNDALDDEAIVSASEAETKKLLRRANLYSKATFFLNALLLIGKAVAAGLTSSISIIGSVLDSAVDLVSGTVMWFAYRATRKHDPFQYPQGRTKLEPVSIIILCSIMGIASAELVIQSIQIIVKIATGEDHTPKMDLKSIILMCITIASKLIFFIISKRCLTPSVKAVALDNKNDVLSNTVSLAFGYLGAKVWPYFDPIGAILISFYILLSWVKQGWKQIKILTGYTANPFFIQKVAFICLNHNAKIKQLDTVRAFHFGTNFLVEVDIVLPEMMTLKEAHDIGEPLQRKLESLPEVERAFVHIDYEFNHKPTSEHKIV